MLQTLLTTMAKDPDVFPLKAALVTLKEAAPASMNKAILDEFAKLEAVVSPEKFDKSTIRRPSSS